jgi:hypothetical protein
MVPSKWLWVWIWRRLTGGRIENRLFDPGSRSSRSTLHWLLLKTGFKVLFFHNNPIIIQFTKSNALPQRHSRSAFGRESGGFRPIFKICLLFEKSLNAKTPEGRGLGMNFFWATHRFFIPTSPSLARKTVGCLLRLV